MTDRTDVYHRLAMLRAEFVRSVPYIAVIGASGSGKSTLVNRLLTHHPDLRQPKAGQNEADVISLLVPSPATLKYVGSTMLGGLGFPLKRDKPASFIWDQVRELLMRRKTLFVHLDEAQDLFSSKNPTARHDVVNTLKSLMNNRNWPVGLILSGTPSMIEMLNADDQLKRRIDMVSLDAISSVSNGNDVRSILQSYVQKADLELSAALTSSDFSSRLIHAGANELGLTIEMILGGIEDALLSQQSELKLNNFSKTFARKSGAIPGLNPFIADDFLAIDPRAVMGTFQLDRGLENS